MTYTLIGTGNMAYFLATCLHEAGFQCKGVWGRNKDEAKKLAQQINTNTFISLNEISDEQDACIIAVSDNAIEEISAQLHLENTVVIHTAGSVSLDALKQKNKAVLWSVYSILKNDLPKKKNIPLVCEAGSPLSEEIVLKIARAISGKVSTATYPQRQWMHLIAALTNNFTNHIVAICEVLSKEQEIDFDLFQPILQQTFERIQTGSAGSFQTGAAKRNDEATMQKHLSLLSAHPHWQQVYKILSASIKDLYSCKNK